MWQMANRRSAALLVSPRLCSQFLRLVETSASSNFAAADLKEEVSDKQKPVLKNNAAENTNHNNNEKMTVMVTSAPLPPLVRSLLLKAVSVLSKESPEESQSPNRDPVSSLFLRSGSANQKNCHGLEFLVDVKKASATFGEKKCVIESDSVQTPLSLNEKLPLSQRIEIYLALGKARLSALVVLTASFGYGLALSGGSSSIMAVSPLAHLATFTTMTIGTAFLALGANTLNQFCEAPYDSQMSRTRNRPLAVRALSPEHALAVGVLSSLIGTATLALTTNYMTTLLGVSNCLLYVTMYTPMKRTSSYNTWIGAIVGTLPPCMGWSAATGGSLDPAAYVLACILFSWQFPHFMALSWNMRGEYARAGYQVQAVVNPNACRQAALRHSLALTGLSSLAVPLTHLAPWSFAFVSLPVNAYLLKLSHRFRHHPNAASARKLFFYSLIYLPTLLTMLAVTNYVGK